MKLDVLQDNLKRGLAIVGRAVPGKSTLPVLSNVLLEATGDVLRLSATNLEVGISHTIAARVEDIGAFTLPAKLLSDVVSNLNNETVNLAFDNNAITVKSGKSTSTMKGIDSDEYPLLPTISGDAITLPCDLLRLAIEQCAPCAATDDTRPVLKAVYLSIADGVSTFAAADGFRLARKQVAVDTTFAPMLIPARALEMLASILDGDTVELRTNGNQASFTTEHTTLTTRLLDGKYPDTDRIMPQQYTTRLVVDTNEMLRALRLASHFATWSSDIVRLSVNADTLDISANAAEVGANFGTVNATVTGEPVNIALNVKYLTEAVSLCKATQVAIELQSAQQPAVLRGVGDETYTQVVMPMSQR